MSKKDELKKAEKAAMVEAEPQTSDIASEQNVDESEVDADLVETGADATSVMSAESAAVNTDTETALEATDGKGKSSKKTAKSDKKAVVKKRSTKYLKAAESITDKTPKKLAEAIELVKGSSYSKFDGTIELHARLSLKKKDTTDSIRALVQLPNGTPNQVKAVVLTEALIDEIAATKKVDADLYLATPALMPKVAKVARILGPQGKMPNPKTGTVTEDPEAALKEISSGRIEYRADSHGIVHLGIAKVSWPADKIAGNVQAIVSSIGANRLRSLSLTSTMGLGIFIDLSSVTA